jgi:hypothetical protein
LRKIEGKYLWRGGDILSWHIPDTVVLAADKFTQFLYWATGGKAVEVFNPS